MSALPSPSPGFTPIRWAEDGRGLVVLDQTALPEEEVEAELRTVEEVAEAIRELRVRGAPLIGITAAMGVAALARTAADEGADPVGLHEGVEEWCADLASTRPTAVNLSWALERMREAAHRASGAGSAELADALRTEADAIRAEDAEMCERLGEHALELLAPEEERPAPATDTEADDDEGDPPTRVLTHCNAGALATGGIGTALAPLHLAHARGRRLEVFVGETRPLLQGSRLTAWELARAGIDVTVMGDGMAAALFRENPPTAVLVGADRIASNGDVANKIGTYGLAVLARHHGVPFYVLAPTSTVDLRLGSGREIPIEHRSEDEIREGFGRTTVAPDARVWSPAFDVTPAELVTAIVTEQGVCRPPLGDCLAQAVRAAQRERSAR